MLAYRPADYPGRLVFLRAAERRPGDPAYPELAWIGLSARGTEVHVVPGDHDSMYDRPQVTALAGVLAARLPGREARREAVVSRFPAPQQPADRELEPDLHSPLVGQER
jgi:thioesterase domain-containing protein